VMMTVPTWDDGVNVTSIIQSARRGKLYLHVFVSVKSIPEALMSWMRSQGAPGAINLAKVLRHVSEEFSQHGSIGSSQR
jgi:hypothetical protein